MKRVVLIGLGLVLVALIGTFLLNGVFGFARIAMVLAPAHTRTFVANADGYLRSISQRELTYYGLTSNGDTLVVWMEVEATASQRRMYAESLQRLVAEDNRLGFRTLQVRNYMTGDGLLDSQSLR